MKAELERERGVALSAEPNARVIEADLFGEGEWASVEGTWELRFERGVSTFPLPQQRAYLTPRNELSHVFGTGSESAIEIGEHVGSGGTPCYLELDELLGKHTAVLLSPRRLMEPKGYTVRCAA